MSQDKDKTDKDNENTLESVMLPDIIPIFPLPGAILMPRSTLPLNIFEPRYLDMVKDALVGNKLIGMIQPIHTEDDLGDDDDEDPKLYTVGCIGRIVEHEETSDGRVLIALKGVCRFKVKQELESITPYRLVQIDWQSYLADMQTFAPIEGDSESAIEKDRLLSCLKTYLKVKGITADWQAIAKSPDEVMVNTLSMIIRVSVPEKQLLLEASTIKDRADTLITLLDMMALMSNNNEDPDGDDSDEPDNIIN